MIYAKLIGAGLVLAALVWLGLIVNDWREQAALVPVLEDRIEQANEQIEAERQQVKDVQAASKGYQNEVKTLREARAAAPAPRPVRLCVVPAAAASPGPHPGEPRPDGADAGARELPPRAGPDIAGRLYGLADRADDLVAQCRGLQDLELRRAAVVRETPAPPQ